MRSSSACASAKAFLARAASAVQIVSVASVPMTPNDSAMGAGRVGRSGAEDERGEQGGGREHRTAEHTTRIGHSRGVRNDGDRLPAMTHTTVTGRVRATLRLKAGGADGAQVVATSWASDRSFPRTTGAAVPFELEAGDGAIYRVDPFEALVALPVRQRHVRAGVRHEAAWIAVADEITVEGELERRRPRARAGPARAPHRRRRPRRGPGPCTACRRAPSSAARARRSRRLPRRSRPRPSRR